MVHLTQASGLHSRVAPLDDPRDVPAPRAAPRGRANLRELLGPAAVLRTVPAARRLAAAPPGDGHLVIDLPGWKAPESAALPLRAYLRWLGYDARPWGLGTNRGTPERDAERLVERVKDLAAERGPVSLVGWSLGGVVAREVARTVPDAIRRVITYGTPVIGGPTYTAGAAAFGAAECARVTALAEELDRDSPIMVPITAIITRRDGVVDWRACVDRYSVDVEHLQVRSTHLGLGLDPDVWAVIADRLAAGRDESGPPCGTGATTGAVGGATSSAS